MGADDVARRDFSPTHCSLCRWKSTLTRTVRPPTITIGTARRTITPMYTGALTCRQKATSWILSSRAALV